MVFVTPCVQMVGTAISEILDRVNGVPNADRGAIFKHAIDAKSVETPAVLMGLWLFESEAYAHEAARVLKLVLSGRPAKWKVWVEPAMSTSIGDADGWVAVYYLDWQGEQAKLVPQELRS